MTFQSFDYDYWKRRKPEDWKGKGLHWHCYKWRATGDQYKSDAERRDPHSNLAPLVVREWLQKPANLLDSVVRSPDEGIEWLSGQWYGLKPNVLGKDAAPDGERLGIAEYELRLGQDVAWGFWLAGASHYVGLYLVATGQGCH